MMAPFRSLKLGSLPAPDFASPLIVEFSAMLTQRRQYAPLEISTVRFVDHDRRRRIDYDTISRSPAD
ncbi:MAG TPA: hypothetical protein VMV15_08585 [Candidatus Binataceae bacterium]|nr:hypothetical protein [Candidatus Binataceae bacterium]